MNELMKYGALAVGGYVLYNWLKNASFMQPAQTSIFTAPLASNIAPNVTGANNITNAAPDARTKILNMTTGDSRYLNTYTDWAYWYHQATGGYAPAFADSTMGKNGFTDKPITVDEFLATARLNGMNGFSGLGFLTLPSYAERNLVR